MSDLTDKSRNSVQWIVERTSSTRKSFSKRIGKIKSWGQRSQASEWEFWDSGCDFMNFFIIKVLFWDIVVSLGDVISDFAQGVNLVMSETQAVYGYLTISINWLPGLVAVIHLLSVERSKLPCKNLILYSCLLMLFYPIVPTLSFIRLMWEKPRPRRIQDANSEDMIKFRKAENHAKIAHSISGGIESPIQLILQIWLILNGKIPAPFTYVDTVPWIVDWHGNKISLPTISSISMIFSALSTFKALIQFNIIREHVQDITTVWKVLEVVVKVFDHAPFFFLATFFRIASMALLITYLNAIGFIPVVIYFFINLAIGYSRFDVDTVPLWLISFVALFMPVHFVNGKITERSRPRLIAIQYEIFFYQTLASILVYVPSLIACCVTVNCNQDWVYDPKVILNNRQFNAVMITLLAISLVSLILSIRPEWSKLLKMIPCPTVRCWSRSSPQEEDGEIFAQADQDPPLRPKPYREKLESTGSLRYLRETIPRLKAPCQRIVLGSLALSFALLPLIFMALFCILERRETIYLSRHISTNETISIQGVVLQDPRPILNTSSLNGNYLVHHFVTDQNTPDTLMERDFPELEILVVDRCHSWTSCIRSPEACFQGVSALMIIDGHERGYLPSFPAVSLEFVPPGIPVYLVQKADADALSISGQGTVERTFRVFSHDKDHFPPTSYLCDLGDGECLPKDKGQLINLSTKRIRGNQYRTTKCFWGGEACNGLSNEQESLEFCDEAFIKERFCKSNGGVFTQESTELGGNRLFRAMMPLISWRVNLNRDSCLAEMRVETCDEASLWTQYVQCDSLSENGHRRRYCQINDQCLLEEIHTTVC